MIATVESERIQELLEQGLGALDAADYPRALECWSQVLTIQPGHERAARLVHDLQVALSSTSSLDGEDDDLLVILDEDEFEDARTPTSPSRPSSFITRTALEGLRSLADRRSEEIVQLRDELDAASAERMQLRTDLAQRERDLLAFREQLLEEQSRSSQLEKGKRELDRIRSRMESELASSALERSELQSSVASLEQRIHATEETLQAETRERETAQTELGNLRAALELARKQRIESEQRITSFEQQLVEKDECIASLTSEHEAIRAVEEASRRECDELTSVLQSVRRAQEAEKDDWMGQMDLLRVALDKAQSDQIRITNELDLARSEAARWQQECDRHREEAERERSRNREEAARFEHERRDLQHRVTTLQEQLASRPTTQRQHAVRTTLDREPLQFSDFDDDDADSPIPRLAPTQDENPPSAITREFELLDHLDDAALQDFELGDSQLTPPDVPPDFSSDSDTFEISGSDILRADDEELNFLLHDPSDPPSGPSENEVLFELADDEPLPEDDSPGPGVSLRTAAERVRMFGHESLTPTHRDIATVPGFSARHAFVASTIDDGMTIADLIDIAGLPPEETSEILVELIRGGVVDCAVADELV